MSGSRPITKALFASGLQCAKKLSLEYHEPEQVPDSPAGRQRLAEVGIRLVELARSAFPLNETADPEDLAKATEQTASWLREKQHVAVFDAAFAIDDLEVRADVAIADGSGGVEIYEVKSGTKVKARHLRDLAFQIHAIERTGLEVRRAWILHLNTLYTHKGGSKYPVLELFKHVDVTAKVRPQVTKVAAQIANLRNVLEDPMTRELPTGTWCHVPFQCAYEPMCRDEGPDLPLIDLPDLTREQESEFHQQGIEELSGIDSEQEGLSPVQQRALRAIRLDQPVVEPFVGEELCDVDYPLHFVEATSLLQVLPSLEGARPWQHVPFQWHDTIIDEQGTTRHLSYVGDGKTDPRPAFVSTLADAVRGAGTVMLYGPSLEHRLRELLEDLPEQKSEVRALLNQPRFDLRQLVRAGVYHPGFHASFGLISVYRGLVDEIDFEDAEIRDDDDAQAACQRLLNSRTRTATRQKLTADLDRYGVFCSDAIAAVFRALLAAAPVS